MPSQVAPSPFIATPAKVKLSKFESSISQLFIYPIKSCAGISVSNLTFDDKGPLLDRRWMLVDADSGLFLSQRELARMALISTRIESGKVYAYQSLNAKLAAEFCLPEIADDDSEGERPCSEVLVNVQVWDDHVKALDCGDEAAHWFSSLLDVSCRLVYQGQCERFASAKYAANGTLVSFADGFPLLAVAQSSIDFLNELCVDAEIAAENFRPNIVIENTKKFTEKNWGSLNTNTLEMMVVKPCERCVIPTLNTKTAEREKSILPVLVDHCREDKKIIFGQNLTFKVSDSARLEVGQPVLIESS